MSDYEKINANVKANVNAHRNEAIKKLVILLVNALMAIAIVTGLEAIGFINDAFWLILIAVTICATAFKAGGIWNDIKF